MEVTVENEKIKVNSSYNKSFVTRAKQIQGNDDWLKTLCDWWEL